MQILFLTFHLPLPEEPGTSRPWQEAVFLSKLGHSVTVITAGTSYMVGKKLSSRSHSFWEEAEIKGIRIIRTYSLPQYRKSMKRRMLQYIIYALLSFWIGLCKVKRPKVVLMATDPIFIEPVGYLLGILRRAKLVLEIRDLYPDTAIALGFIKSKVLINLLYRWQRFFYTKAKGIMVATPGIKRMLIDKKINKNKIVLIPSVFSIAEWTAGNYVEPQEKFALPMKFKILYIGKFGQANEFMTIIHAAEIVQNIKKDIGFIFIGDGEKKNDCISYCKEKGIKNCVFLPPRPRKYMPFFMKNVDVCIQAFKKLDFWRCALSTKIFDYLIFAKPIIYAGIGDAAELIKEAKAGIVVAPEEPRLLVDAIIKLYEDPGLKKDMSQQGRDYIKKNYSKEQLLVGFERVLSYE